MAATGADQLGKAAGQIPNGGPVWAALAQLSQLRAIVVGELARRRMTVATGPDEPAEATGPDTGLGSCRDFDHSPLDGGGTSR